MAIANKNPLYGRKTGHIKLDFLKFRYFKDFFPRYNIEENIRTYAILGGVPFYLDKLKEKVKFVNWNNEDRKEYYAVAARSFSKKTGHARCLDMNELENVLAQV